MNQAGAPGVLPVSLKLREEGVLSMGGWVFVGLSAMSLGSGRAGRRAHPDARPASSLRKPTRRLGHSYRSRREARGTPTSSVFRILARQQGVRDATIQANVPGLTDQSAGDRHGADRARGEKQRRSRRNAGALSALARHRHRWSGADRAITRTIIAALRSIELRYGVDPAILMSIWGHETSYGTVTGSTDLLQALASLGYYGRRRDFFESEFIAALKLMDQGVPRWRLKGQLGRRDRLSAIHALGRASPSRRRRWRRLCRHLVERIRRAGLDRRCICAMPGWKPNVAWGIAVRTPANLNRAAIVSRVTAPRCPQVYRRQSRWLSMREWRAIGRHSARAHAARQ